MVINGGTAATGLAGMRKQYSHDRAVFLAANPWVKPNLQDYDRKKLNVAVHVRLTARPGVTSISIPTLFVPKKINYPRTGSVKTLLQAQIRQSDQPQDEAATLRQMAMILEAAPQLAAEAGYDKKQ